MPFPLPMTRTWADSFISRHQTELIETRSTPREEPDLQVLLEETMRAVRKAIRGCPAGLVFNLDEVVISEWEDRKVKSWWLP
jgi:hypothetical protein